MMPTGQADTGKMEAVFLEEMGELLQDSEKALLCLADSLDDYALVGQLFRNFHTIKGGAGMVGMEPLAHYTHVVENMLDNVRRKTLSLTPDLVTLLLDALDCLKNFVSSAQGIEPLDVARLEKNHDSIVATTEKSIAKVIFSPPTLAPIPAPVQRDRSTCIIQIHARPDFFPPSSELATVTEALGQLGNVLVISHEHSLPPLDQLQSGEFYLWRSVHLVTSANTDHILAAMGHWPTEHRVEILALDRLPDVPENQGQIDAAVDDLPRVASGTTLEKRSPDRGFAPSQPIVAASVPPASPGNSGVVTADPDHQKPPQTVTPAPMQRLLQLPNNPGSDTVDIQSVLKLGSIRVDTSKLDKLVNLVGELITVSARLDSFQSFMETRNPELAEDLLEILDDSSRIVDELQDQALTIRMVPVGSAFDPAKRLVHDYCKNTGKKAHLTIVGYDTEVDKKVAEQLNGPLRHLIRNALDHGIEPSAEREMAGKVAEGQILLMASHQYGLIVIEVKDDGRGIDVQRVICSAREKGIIDDNRDLTEREGMELIFAPAVSTATEVTEISGRGVGMDVVKRDIEALRGTIEIGSSLGKGTTFTLRIPTTLSIVDGLLVCVGDNRYIIPLSMVEECVELASDLGMDNGSSFLDMRGVLVPFLRLRDLFKVPGEMPLFEKIVIVSSGIRRIGMVVDRLLGNHQTVIKSLSPLHRGVQCFMGATIMGDGNVVLILDVLHLIDLGQKMEEKRRAKKRRGNL
ncbi:MAG: chemotaxis protein CheA [Magnetococcales bacterium]|nr:chemotaxis protein CheA [Magnetococcales bacterium]MBF0630624.1 chemotaxis protein CheA [Magnetococcales bacterium]